LQGATSRFISGFLPVIGFLVVIQICLTYLEPAKQWLLATQPSRQQQSFRVAPIEATLNPGSVGQLPHAATAELIDQTASFRLSRFLASIDVDGTRDAVTLSAALYQ